MTLGNDIENAILGIKTQPYFSCPPTASNCTYPAFKTLGICSRIQDHTKDVEPSCDKGSYNETTCRLRWNGGDIQLTLNKPHDPHNPQTSGRLSDVFRLLVSNTTTTNPYDFTMTAMRVQTTGVVDSIRTGTPPSIEFLTLQWYWCAQSHPLTHATAAHLTASSVTSEPLEFYNLSSDEKQEWVIFRPGPVGQQYRVYRDTASSIWGIIGLTLDSSVLLNTGKYTPGVAPLVQDLGTEKGRCRSYLEMFLYSSDLRSAAESVAAILSNYIRSGKAGDNTEASTVEGLAWANETYIEVRWWWLVPLLVQTVLVSLLLVATIFSAKRSAAPLLGSSPLGLLFCGLDGQATEMTHNLGMMSPRRRMAATAREINVVFTDTGSGKLGFVSTNGENDEMPSHQTHAAGRNGGSVLDKGTNVAMVDPRIEKGA